MINMLKQVPSADQARVTPAPVQLDRDSPLKVI
jgi:hypothetical protein